MRRVAFALCAVVVLSATDHSFARNVPVSAPADDGTVREPGIVTICHGFGCRQQTRITLNSSDHATLARLMAAGRGSPAAERRAVAAAGAWFDRRVAPAAGTKNHMARAGISTMFDTGGQFDCIDSSRNTTELLQLLDRLRLLRHHEPEEPVARGYVINGQMPHATAVLTEKTGGTRWAVDSWTRAYGQAPEILPLARWMDQR